MEHILSSSSALSRFRVENGLNIDSETSPSAYILEQKLFKQLKSFLTGIEKDDEIIEKLKSKNNKLNNLHNFQVVDFYISKLTKIKKLELEELIDLRTLIEKEGMVFTLLKKF